jgi:cell division protein YceG involved in septum cleavage
MYNGPMKRKRGVSAIAASRIPERVVSITVTSLFAVLCVLSLFLIKSKEFVFETATPIVVTPLKETVEVFPIGVNPLEKTIVENPEINAYIETHLSANVLREHKREGWFTHTLALLTQFDWYQNLASPISRILVIDSGERKEEVISHFSKILRWSKEEGAQFESLVAGSSPSIDEGKFFPGHYVVSKDATPEEVAAMLTEQFDTQVLSRYPEEVSSVVPLEDALAIASLLEREAYDFTDMREISGIIWNRLFVDMPLQLDASLQYARANNGGNTWWPTPVPADKYINSPFNTYKNKGLPPTPIANPSSEAILAALNPKATECLFYFHDKDGGFHCSVTYEEHVKALKEIYGRGR